MHGHVDTCLPLDPTVKPYLLILQLRRYFVKAPCVIGSRDRSVGIANRLGISGPGFEFWQWKENVLFSTSSGLSSGTPSLLFNAIFLFRDKLAFVAWKRTVLFSCLYYHFNIILPSTFSSTK